MGEDLMDKALDFHRGTARRKVSNVRRVPQNTILFRSIWVVVTSEFFKLNSMLCHLQYGVT